MFKVHAVVFWCMMVVTLLAAQPEVAPWSNIAGIRLDGELMELNSTLGLVGNIWSDEGTEILGWRDTGNPQPPLQVYFALMTGHLKKGTSTYKSFTICASGIADCSPLALVLDTTKPGRPHKGIGGNFRLKNSTTGPPVDSLLIESTSIYL